jgi:hypothetical protein
MDRVANRAASIPGPMPPTQALRMMARKKTGVTSPSGRTRNVRINAMATDETARPYLRAADVIGRRGLSIFGIIVSPVDDLVRTSY